jgi:nucleoside-diphosphate kinase
MTELPNHLTLGMIKPHAIRSRKAGEIISRIEDADFAILNAKTVQLSKEGAELFYAEHKDKDFFENLVNVMSNGPVWALVLMKHDAANEFRKLIGATDPAKAEPGTIRSDFGNHENITDNAIHGSANDQDSVKEILFFFERDLKLARALDEADNESRIQ